MVNITATFSIWSKLIRPDRISKLLSVEPDRAVLRGAERDPPRPVPEAYGWHLSCRDQDELLIENTLVKLLARVRGLQDRLPDLFALDADLYTSVTLSISPYQNNLSLLLSSTTIEDLAKIKSSLDIDFFPQPD